MSYEYDVPYIDFITSFGENDGADRFFDLNTELEKLSLIQTPGSQGKKNQEKYERPILQEIPGNVKNTGSAQSHRRDMQISSCSNKSLKGQKPEYRTAINSVSQNLKSQVALGFTNPVSASKTKKHIQTIEEVNGKLCVKNNEVKHTGVPRTIPNQRTRTVIQHSFEERQKLQMLRRGVQIKEVLEEEQRKRQFHANPIPNYLKLTKRKSTPARKSTCKSSQNSGTNAFQARPAYVVHKKPFLPRKLEHSVVKPGSVTLHTEKRAKARQEFDEKLRLHYKELESQVRARKEEQLEKEKREIAELRKKLVHKAQPVPMYKSVHVLVNSKHTQPKDSKNV